jgi:beta-glucanase (GH16 family)
MKKLLAWTLLLGLAWAQNLSPWKLVWADEFNKPAGQAVDSGRWNFELGGGGFGNAEMQFYTNSTKNAAHDGKGHLVITALNEQLPSNYYCVYSDCQFSSARLNTKGKFAWQYGRFEARMQLPFGQGIWPALWLLGANIDQVPWPDCGEIDIMENIGREPNMVHATVHGPGYSGANGIGKAYTLSRGKFADAFHVFALEWEPKALRWYVDGKLHHSLTPAQLPSGKGWVFDHPFYLIVNVAVGGMWPGIPDKTTPFPQRMRVDYVRVYQR